ncbi:hypothetical protein O9H85_24530 [Paenibacillus filicis]|uniref:Uncharacterized protein n=1 Tax=Paenibacillus gyeongsangnamensis TaxID=3388067 RepID=A0ABT4QF56_9BACL|nr:hypothetical protein [Paenibacillus filicis]MCZ8515514.1 hypothetical protein [Paenibacillus filicis]
MMISKKADLTKTSPEDVKRLKVTNDLQRGGKNEKKTIFINTCSRCFDFVSVTVCTRWGSGASSNKFYPSSTSEWGFFLFQ